MASIRGHAEIRAQMRARGRGERDERRAIDNRRRVRLERQTVRATLADLAAIEREMIAAAARRRGPRRGRLTPQDIRKVERARFALAQARERAQAAERIYKRGEIGPPLPPGRPDEPGSPNRPGRPRPRT